MTKRIISFLLLSVMLLAFLCSCGEDKKKDDDDKGGNNPVITDIDLNGESIKLIIADTETSPYCGVYKYGTKYMVGPESKAADTVLNLCYDRNKNVRNALNVKVTFEKATKSLSSNDFFAVQAMLSSPVYDSAITDVNAAASAQMNGNLYNLNLTTEKNYFDFTDPSWYQDYMDSYTLYPDKHYMLAGDYFISVLQNANVIYMNTDYYTTNVAKSVDMSFEDFVDVICAKEFDIDLFIELINYGWVSNTGESQVTAEDGIGLLCHRSVFVYPFVYSSDRFVYKKDQNGEYMLEENPSDFADMVMKVSEIYHAKGSLVNQYGNDTAPVPSSYIDHFVKENTLFMQGFHLGDLENTKLLAMEDKVAIPYPLTDLEQEDYITHISSSAEIGVILKNTSHFSAVSAYYQTLNENSTDILSQYYEFSLKFKYSTDSKAGALLDLVHETIASSRNKFLSEFIYINAPGLSSGDEMKSIFLSAISKNVNDIANRYASVYKAWDEGLKALKKKLLELE